ncbi:MAG: glycosyltransferase family 4 protein [Actinomycetota bacterium]
MNTPVASSETRRRIADLAADSGIGTVHLLGWRDLDDPEAGGSEVHAHNIASIWTQSGLDVTIRTSAAVGRPPSASRDGYSVSRRGSRYTVFPRSALAEITGRLGPCDGLVEIWNGMPFLSPIWRRGPRMIWLHHIHGPMWAMSQPGPIAAAGVALEERIAPRIYRRQHVVTLSSSSRNELLDHGFQPDLVEVIPPGVDPGFTAGGTRSATPLAVAVGRLVPVKDFPRLVTAFARVHAQVEGAELQIVGEGYERPVIEAAIAEHGAGDYVRLLGRISDPDLLELYRRAWVVTSASIREGWGMTITEAGACGTPAVVSDIAGHADAVIDGRSGRLAPDEDSLVNGLIGVLGDPVERDRLGSGALGRASDLTWENASIANFEVLATDALERRPSSGRTRPTLVSAR